MAQTWFIGSAVVDVIINIDHLPKREEDLSVQANTMQMGGCAYNASDCFFHFKSPYRLLCPVGTGVYGNFVREHFKAKNIELLLPSQDENGCCYCFVEKDGERTFLSYHGAEYRFNENSFPSFKTEANDAIYVSGIEIEEETGIHILDFLEKSKYQHLLLHQGLDF